jgi:pimeloyl-ACP methyl ester carboxylesterase
MGHVLNVAIGFDAFDMQLIEVGETTIFARRGGGGAPLLLLHGFPETHVMWHRVAPMLAATFTVVCADLRGYGASGTPSSTDDHAPSTLPWRRGGRTPRASLPTSAVLTSTRSENLRISTPSAKSIARRPQSTSPMTKPTARKDARSSVRSARCGAGPAHSTNGIAMREDRSPSGAPGPRT